MSLLSPKFVALDSSTWGRMAQTGWHGNSTKRVFALIERGTLIPFLTWHHLQEIIQHGAEHGNDETFEQRVALLSRLPFVAYPRQPHPNGNVGDITTLREWEFKCLLQNPKATLDIVLETARSHLIHFSTGQRLCDENYEWWRIYREHFAVEAHQRQIQIATLTHFPVAPPDSSALGRGKKPRLRAKEAALQKFKEMAATLESRMRAAGDSRLSDPSETSARFMEQIFHECSQLYDMEGNPEENLLKLLGVDRECLPPNATLADLSYEAIFVQQRALAEKRLNLPIGALASVRQEMVPTWLLWRELDKRIKRAQKAAGSNLLDKLIASFAPYIDAIEVDKRIAELFRQIRASKPLVIEFRCEILRGGELERLAARLEEFST